MEESGKDKWTATDPITGMTETRPTKWQAIQALVNRLSNNESVTAAVLMHGQGQT